MAKRKVIIEAVTRVVFDLWHEDHHYTGEVLDRHAEYLVEVETKGMSKDNLGGEIWEWAQQHWPEYAGPYQTVCLPGVDDEVIMVRGLVHWVCVSGVKTAKGSDLPVIQLHEYNASNRRYANSKKGKKAKPIKETPAKNRRKKTKTASKRRSPAPAKAKMADKPKNAPAKAKMADKPKKSQIELLAEGTDVEAVKEAKIRAALEEDDD